MRFDTELCNHYPNLNTVSSFPSQENKIFSCFVVKCLPPPLTCENHQSVLCPYSFALSKCHTWPLESSSVRMPGCIVSQSALNFLRSCQAVAHRAGTNFCIPTSSASVPVVQCPYWHLGTFLSLFPSLSFSLSLSISLSQNFVADSLKCNHYFSNYSKIDGCLFFTYYTQIIYILKVQQVKNYRATSIFCNIFMICNIFTPQKMISLLININKHPYFANIFSVVSINKHSFLSISFQ